MQRAWPRDDVRVRAATGGEIAGWDALVSQFPQRRVVHRRAWLESIERSGQGRPLYLIIERHGQTVGCLPGLVAQVGPLRVFGSPLPGCQTASMGPLFDPERVSTAALLQAALAELESGHGVHHVEVVSDALEQGAMVSLGFQGRPVPTFRAPLHPDDPARTFRQLHDTARRNVRRAERLGLVVSLGNWPGLAAEAYRQIEEVFVRGGNMVPFGLSRVEAFVACMEADASLLAVTVRLPESGEAVACGLFTVADHELLLWQWAHRPSQRWYRATELMTWTVMRHAMERGCTTFDLMGEGDFKAHFGATLQCPHQRWVRSRYRWITPLRDAAERAYRWQQGTRGRVARWASGAPRHTPPVAQGAT